MGNDNTFIGAYAGSRVTGRGNVIVGFSAAAFLEPNLNDRLIIGTPSGGGQPLLDGNFQDKKLKVIGDFEITKGALKIADGTQSLGKVLTSDANGVATWQDQKSAVKTVSADYTLLEEDDHSYIFVDSVTAATITVPSGLPPGFNCEIIQEGAGDVYLSGNLVNLNAGSGTHIRTRYSLVKIIMKTDTTGILTGDFVQ
ncbi:hypothetical protein BOQ62_01870 [Chryseobacterium sp. CH21]|uniref:hypothetical protein n=1 Tax=Chryseobacterium sp. CH21 TaxID=713556 RepID=UPI00100C05A7|nr:hypothetical protein [Chryseobacterium sp. CH21]RXM41298.1 hypothetical protein BOQ62_01870 [Chryseobacterium sp. CH21]